MKFIVKPYVLYHQDERRYCYTHRSSVKISHSSMVDLLEFMLQKKIDFLSEEDVKSLSERYDLPYQATLNFLKNDLAILASHNEEQFQNLYIFSDNADIRQALTQEFSKHYGLNVFASEKLCPIAKPKSLALLFSANYQEQAYKDLYHLPHPEDTYFITAFLADKYLIIDNIYNKQMGVPCHFCAINQLKAVAMTSPELQGFSWLLFYRELLKNKASFCPASPLSVMNKHLTIYILCKFIKRYVDPSSRELWCDSVNEFWHADLEQNKIEREAAIHWELCDCVNA
jgi:McbB family protein